MNESNDPRLLQRLVPADERGCEPCPPLVNSLIPADRQNGSPALVELPQFVEALVADLEAVRRREEWARTRYLSGPVEKYDRASYRAEMVREIMALVRSRSATGGNA